ncbi:MAG: hypothetical protein JW874_13030 [Spirochaetales bacterium]|nr:hypothetical protein [Spirochaetales bacterium]
MKKYSVLVCSLLLFGCKSTFTPIEIGNPGNSTKVLIITEKTDFKMAVIDGISARAKAEGWYLRIIDASAFSEADQDNWDAFVMMGAIRIGRIDSRANAVLAALAGSGKAVVLVTKGPRTSIPGSVQEVLPVDAVTAASDKGLAADTAVQILEILAEKL